MTPPVFWFYAAAMVMAGLICLLAVLLVLDVRITTRLPLWLRRLQVWGLALLLKAPCPTCGHIGEWMGDTKTERWWYCDHCRQPWIHEKHPKSTTKAVA